MDEGDVLPLIVYTSTQRRLVRQPGAREPGEAGFVVAPVLDLLAQDLRAVDRGREGRSDRSQPAPRSANSVSSS